MKTIKLIGVLFGLLAFTNLGAQEVTDYDLQNFARAYKDMVKLNKTAQMEMAEIIQKEGLDLETYHAINESKDSEYEPDVPKEDFKKFDKIQPKIQLIQDELEADVEKAYNKHDLSKKDYSAIAERVKLDQLLQIKLESILAKMK